MRPHAPSLDVIAAQSASSNRGGARGSGPGGLGPQERDRDEQIQDSRSTSSTSSPAPAEYEESDFFLVANDSQSSLGVPNLQDMQVTDDECLPPINRLPNEILISIFAKLNQSSDLLHCMLTCKRWARNSVDILWHRPACTTWQKHSSICQTLGLENPYFSYRDFIKRLNLAALADKANDGSVIPLAVCTRVERLTLTNCKELTDSGLTALVQNSTHLLALDISGDNQVTEKSIIAISENCRRLQGLNISSCTKINPDSMVELAKNCRYIKRLKLNDCAQLTDDAILAFAEHCPNILEIDLHQCRLIGNDPVTALLAKGQSLRELRLANCELINDAAFLSLPQGRSYEHLRILDLTSCAELTDRAVEKIIDVAPRLRNLVLAKCRNITDAAVYAISRLGKNLHYVHLGHCGHITDDAVKRLVQCCNRIRYIDLGCCVHLTDDSVTRLAQLPKLKRIGLVKCASITDESVYALAKANHRIRQRRDADGNVIAGEHTSHSSLERVHLSYCTNLTLKSIVKLLNCCPRLTHLSLTGVQAFLRSDLEAFCRDAPPEFTEHQRSVFCVFSGQGVIGLRRYLNNESAFASLNEEGFNPGRQRPRELGDDGAQFAVGGAGHGHNHADGGFEEQEADVVDDDDGLDDGSEMVIDTQPLLSQNHLHGGQGIGGVLGGIPPPPPAPATVTYMPNSNNGYVEPMHQVVRFPEDPEAFAQIIQPRSLESDDDDEGDAMDVSPGRPSTSGASTASLGGHGSRPREHPSRGDVPASAGPIAGAAGPSTASIQTTGPRRGRAATPYVDGDASPSSNGGSPDES